MHTTHRERSTHVLMCIIYHNFTLDGEFVSWIEIIEVNEFRFDIESYCVFIQIHCFIWISIFFFFSRTCHQLNLLNVKPDPPLTYICVGDSASIGSGDDSSFVICHEPMPNYCHLEHKENALWIKSLPTLSNNNTTTTNNNTDTNTNTHTYHTKRILGVYFDPSCGTCRQPQRL